MLEELLLVRMDVIASARVATKLGSDVMASAVEPRTERGFG